jgi:hypothetical protein
VFGQYFLARLAQPGAVLLQAGQHGLIAFAHDGAAMTGNIAGAGVMALLLRRRPRGHQNKRNDEENSGHDVAPAGDELDAF